MTKPPGKETERKKLEAKRKRAEEALRTSESQYRELVALAPIGIYRSTRDGRFTSVNQSLVRLLGYDSPAELLRLDIRKEVYFDNAERERLIARREHEPDFTGIEVRWKRRDGSPVWVSLESRAIRGDSGAIDYFEGFVHDIDQRKRAEESMNKLLRAVEQARNVIFMTDPEGAINYVNPAFEATYGFSKEEALGKTPRILKSGQRDQAYYKRFWQRLLAGESIREELVNKRRDGQLVNVEVSVSPVLDAQGRRAGFIAVQADITERKRAEESLRGSEQRYRSLFESMLHGYAYCELLFENGEPQDFVYLDVNTNFEVLTGLKNVVGRRVTEVIPGIRESSPELIQVYGRVALTGIPEKFEIYVDSLGIWFSISAYSPQKGYFVALFDNITERKRAEDTLRRSEERRRALMEHALDAVLVLSPDGTILEANRAAETLAGRPRGEQVGRSFLELLQAEDRDAVAGRFARMLETGYVHDSSSVLRPDGRTIPIEISASRVDVGGGPLVLAIVRDVSERRQLENQLRQSQKMEAVGQLAGGIAHDFNNLLTAILGYADLLAAQFEKGEAIGESLLEIRKAGERAASLTRQLLAFSRRQVLEPKVLEVNALIENIHNMLSRLIGEDIELQVVLQPGVGRVRADAGQLEQVIMNLAVNARDAMPQGGRLTIETADVDLDKGFAAQHATVRPGLHVMLSVSDTGVGMDTSIQSHLFEPFFTTKEKGKGTGLGLATVYGIVKQSGGSIWAYSEPGKGTTFKVYLPRVEEAPSSVGLVPAAAVVLGGSETILIVEDEEAVRRLTRRLLEARGYRILEAGNGAEGLAAAREHRDPIHLLLTDMVMPDMTGTELAARLQESRRNLRVLFMSGYTDDAVVRNGLLGPGRLFLQKPFTPDALARKVRAALA
jgi:two-component system cell cycle sensor histidine kinase/response regulator CckA